MLGHDNKELNQSDSLYKEAVEVGFEHFCGILIRTAYTTPLAWTVIFAVSYNYTPLKNVIIWFVVFFVHWSISLILMHKIKADGPVLCKHRYIIYGILAINGILWGSVFYALMGYNAILDSWITTLLAGIVSASIAGYVFFPKAFHVFVLSMWLSATISVVAISDRFDMSWKLIITMFIYCLVLMYMLKPISYKMIDSIRVQLVNKALADQLQSSLKTVSHQANTDALTGLSNRHSLNKSLTELIVKGERRRNTFSLLMIDIDFFKDINDKYGHAIGDKAIQHIARCISGQLRDEDLCARFGGEEFVVLLPNTNTTEAMYVAERIRKAVELTPMKKPFQRMTLSIGLATHQHGMTAEMLLKAADDEVYVAKANGRNQVRIAQTDTFSSLPKASSFNI